MTGAAEPPRPFEAEYEVAPGVVVRRTGGHTPGAQRGPPGVRLTFAGDAVFDRPEWHNGFGHDPQEPARVRVGLLRELVATGEPLVATQLSFASFGHVWLLARTSQLRLVWERFH